ncbi:polyunsaturated fatty acid 5-lipoxygenase-like isoform X2 [Biomphalaria glabrata]|uniref:Polyunsaturated fatty acid 5-lipoxygenase-like isoform X2 n=1 Tax=Biomphalaria glabrata TaxID=6526 RepID=A0A9W3B1Z0_BIOGL|nr:polyunsaturated fatty acid 5-lipoxygenase-like isoform X2 [Biomphalaria glabrata]
MMGGCFGKKSGEIMIYVQTGDRRNAGTDANVKIVMHDEYNHASDPITLDNYFKNDFERGCLDTFYVPSSKIRQLQRMGKIVRIELWRNDAGVASDWYVDKIVIENRVTNSSFVFPIFRWIKAKYHYQIKHLDTSLPQQEEFPEQRKMELAEKRKEYEFDQKVPGAPVQVKSMPSDEQFSFDYKWDIVKTKMKLIAVSKLVMLTKGEWADLSDLKNVYTRDIFYQPYQGADRWSNDLYFGLQRVASLNHSLIELVKEMPDKLPVTDELLQPLLEGYTIAEAIADKKLFICDLKVLEGISNRDGFVLCKPIGLFYCDKSNQLKPVAIQLFQKPGPDNPIFTPLNPSLTWALVKMWYNNADAAYHQALTHLGCTHLLMEGVTVATHRNLSQSHPIFKLLAPHFLYLIAINTRGLELLIAEGGWVDKTMNYGTKGLMELIIKGLNQWRMDVDGTLPEDLKRRGLDDTNVLPCYHFRNDALLLHQAIKKYVRAYIDLYYTSPELLENDIEVQGWAEELAKPRNYSSGGVGLLGVPGNGRIKTNEQLEMIVTSIIYTCSISHASTNFPQYDEYAFPPNYPGLLRGKPPCNVSWAATERDILNALPDRPTTLDIMIVTKILSSKGTKSIGDFEVQFVFDPKACEVLDQFRKDLHAINETIKERNLHRNPPYEYLKPEIIPNSISI